MNCVNAPLIFPNHWNSSDHCSHNRDKACELLAPVYEWFTEGFDTRDLKEAKTLLEQLA